MDFENRMVQFSGRPVSEVCDGHQEGKGGEEELVRPPASIEGKEEGGVYHD